MGLAGSSKALRRRRGLLQASQCEIELQYGDARLAEEPQLRLHYVLCNESSDHARLEFAHSGHARALQECVRRADIWIEPASRACYGVDRNGSVGGQPIMSTVLRGELPDTHEAGGTLFKLQIVGRKVGATRGGTVVTVATRRRPRLQPLWAAKLLPDQLGADDGSPKQCQAAACLVWKQQATDQPKRNGGERKGFRGSSYVLETPGAPAVESGPGSPPFPHSLRLAPDAM
jgi:hypothetical protein